MRMQPYPVNSRQRTGTGVSATRHRAGLGRMRRQCGQCDQCNQCNQCGFTLVELLVTMVVIAILAVVALPRFSLVTGYDEIGYRDQVRATLEFARKSAVAQRRYVCVSRTGSNLAVSIDLAIPETRLPTICPRQQNLNLPGSGSNTIVPRGTTTLLGTSAAHVVFDALGRPWTSASATASTSAIFTVHGESDYVVTVEAETGYVH